MEGRRKRERNCFLSLSVLKEKKEEARSTCQGEIGGIYWLLFKPDGERERERERGRERGGGKQGGIDTRA